MRIKADIQKVQKLINIARPFALPPLKMETVASDAPQSKKNLPLFGKKKTFGFDKLKQQVANKMPATSNESKVSQSDLIEEFDEEEKVVDSKPAKPSTEAIEKAVPEQPLTIETQKVPSKSCVEPIKDSATETPTKEIKTKRQDIKMKEKSPDLKDNSIQKASDDNEQLSGEASNIQHSSSSGAINKNKSKHRQRNKVRHQIDIDDIEEDKSPQKYSGWMPPENQSGDGMTALNSKYGY